MDSSDKKTEGLVVGGRYIVRRMKEKLERVVGTVNLAQIDSNEEKDGREILVIFKNDLEIMATPPPRRERRGAWIMVKFFGVND